MEEFTTIKIKEYDKNSGRVVVENGTAKVVDLVTVEREIQIDNSRAVKKWKPILDALKIPENIKETERVYSDIDPYGEENWNDLVGEVDPFRVFASVYAEFHTKRMSFGPIGYGPNGLEIENGWSVDSIGDIGQNLLPASMKVLSELNIRDKNYEIRSGLPTTQISVKVSQDQLDDMKALGMDLIQKLERTLIDMLVNHINKQMETKDTIYIESLVNKLSLVSRGFDPPLFILTSKYEIV